jgi:predicted nucleotidyltransferase
MVERNLDIGKRFIVPKDSICQVRLHETQNVIDEVKKEYPEVLSLCAFGSTTKGKAKESSDIDGWLFVDSSEVANKYGLEEKDIVDVLDAKSTNTDEFRFKYTYFNENIIQKYGMMVKNQLKQKLNLLDEQVAHIRPRPISEAIIDDYVEEGKKWYEGEKKYEKEIDEYINSRMRNNFSVERPRLNNPIQLGSLSEMFHMAIGQGIGKYRTYLIDKLNSMGDCGEKIWAKIIEETEMMENHLEIGTGVFYPRALNQAEQIYSSRK